MGPKFETMSKHNRIWEIPLYVENYEENDGTIAGSPNLQKVTVFYELQLKTKSCCADLDSQVSILGTKQLQKTSQTQKNGHRLGFA